MEKFYYSAGFNSLHSLQRVLYYGRRIPLYYFEMVKARNKTIAGCLFFECRKRKDLYLWMAKCPNGPSVKFLVNAVHTMEELKLIGNHLKGSRLILTFASDFDTQPHWQLLKEIITQIFCTPKEHRKAKPFFDHVFVFSIDNHIWFWNYQISIPHHGTEKIERGGLDKMTLIAQKNIKRLANMQQKLKQWHRRGPTEWNLHTIDCKKQD